MMMTKTSEQVRGFIIVDQPWSAIENAAVLISQLRILRYADILPEVLLQ
jgi:hypothetical protein